MTSAHAESGSARCPSRQPVRRRRAQTFTHYGQWWSTTGCRRFSIDSSAAANIAAGVEKSAAGTPPSRSVKRGLAMTPVKSALPSPPRCSTRRARCCRSTRTGTVLLNHGGTEMGQGLHVKVAQVVAAELDCRFPHPYIGDGYEQGAEYFRHGRLLRSDLNGKAAQAAAITVRRTARRRGIPEVRRFCAEVCFATAMCKWARSGLPLRNGERPRGTSVVVRDRLLPHAKIGIRPQARQPLLLFAFGAAVAESWHPTGETQLLRVDILTWARR